jgi:hypothetical protein
MNGQQHRTSQKRQNEYLILKVAKYGTPSRTDRVGRGSGTSATLQKLSVKTEKSFQPKKNADSRFNKMFSKRSAKPREEVDSETKQVRLQPPGGSAERC